MNHLLKEISVAGIIKPGEIYVINETPDRGWDGRPIEYLYTITCAEEIRPALEMEMAILAECYEIRRFLGQVNMSNDCHRFILLCSEKSKNREIEYSFYLHRLWSFQQKLASVKEIYGELS
jgi:hypothetical protein